MEASRSRLPNPTRLPDTVKVDSKSDTTKPIELSGPLTFDKTNAFLSEAGLKLPDDKAIGVTLTQNATVILGIKEAKTPTRSDDKVISHAGYLYQKENFAELASLLDAFPEAVDRMKKASDKGNKGASYKLSQYYANQQQYIEAQIYLKRAAGQKHQQACDELGEMYLVGQQKWGINTDISKAMKHFRRADEYGHPRASLMLARCAAKKNDQFTAHYFRAAIKKNNLYSSTARYEYFLHFPKSQEGLSHLKKAAELGLVEAHHKLGQIYCAGSKSLNIAQSRTMASKHLREAHKLGHPTAMVELGEFFNEGHKNPAYRSAASARECFEKAVREGKDSDGKAQTWLSNNPTATQRIDDTLTSMNDTFETTSQFFSSAMKNADNWLSGIFADNNNSKPPALSIQAVKNDDAESSSDS